MDCKRYDFNSTLINSFYLTDIETLFCFTINTITRIMHGTNREIKHPLLTNVDNVIQYKSEKTYLITTETGILLYEIENDTITKILRFDYLDEFYISPNQKYLYVNSHNKKKGGKIIGGQMIAFVDITIQIYLDLKLISTYTYHRCYECSKYFTNSNIRRCGYNNDYISEHQHLSYIVAIDNNGYLYTYEGHLVRKIDLKNIKNCTEFKDTRGTLVVNLSPDSKLIFLEGTYVDDKSIRIKSIDVLETKTLKLIHTINIIDKDGTLTLSPNKTKIFKITSKGIEIYDSYNLNLLSYIGVSKHLNIFCKLNIFICDGLLYLSKHGQYIEVYNIKYRKYLGYSIIPDQNSEIHCFNNKDLFRIDQCNGYYIIRHYNMTLLNINKQIKALLNGEDSINSPIYKFTHDVLYDYHLMKEITDFLPKLIK